MKKKYKVVSIHAPVKGATKTSTIARTKKKKFQSTRP